MKNERRVIVYIAMSIDGFIATKDGDLQFLSAVQIPGEDFGYGEFIQQVDTVILGRKTYDKVMSMTSEFPHLDKTTYVISRKKIDSNGSLHFYSGDLKNLVTSLKETSGKNIFVDGGAEIIHQLMLLDLIDEFIISIIPVLLGDGIRLFKDDRPEQKMKLRSSKSFASGLIQSHFVRERS